MKICKTEEKKLCGGDLGSKNKQHILIFLQNNSFDSKNCFFSHQVIIWVL